MRSPRLTATLTALACAACFGCGSDSGTTAVPLTASVQAANSSNTVPWNGTPITGIPECAGIPNTWLFTTVFTETVGVAVSLTSTVNVIDGTQRSPITGNIDVPAKGSVTVNRRFCFGQASQHTVQSTFLGTDANGHTITVAGSVVILAARQ